MSARIWKKRRSKPQFMAAMMLPAGMSDAQVMRVADYLLRFFEQKEAR